MNNDFRFFKVEFRFKKVKKAKINYLTPVIAFKSNFKTQCFNLLSHNLLSRHATPGILNNYTIA